MCVFEILILVQGQWDTLDVRVALAAAKEFDWVTCEQRASAALDELPRGFKEGAVESALREVIDRCFELQR